jgi:hypothetical protein
MGPGERVPAVLAGTARARLSAVAEEALTEPECQPLLSDAEWTVQQQGARERIATNGVVEARAENGVAVDGEKGHGYKVRAARVRERVPKASNAARFMTIFAGSSLEVSHGIWT